MGSISPDGTPDEFSENCGQPIKDFSKVSPHSEDDECYTYCLADIDKISEELGIPWEKSKDQPFTNSTLYIGFVWNLEVQTVSLSQTKIDKYSVAINKWLIRPHVISMTPKSISDPPDHISARD